MAFMADFLADCMEGISHWGTGGWIWMGLMMLAGLIVIVAVVYLLIKGTSSTQAQAAHTAPPQTGTPIEIAQRRYAAGEITQEEFERIKRDLSG